MNTNQNIFKVKESSTGDPFFCVPKMVLTRKECSHITGFKLLCSNPEDSATRFVPKGRFTHGESSQALDTKVVSSEHPDRSELRIDNPPFSHNQTLYSGDVRTSNDAKSFNNALLNKEFGDRLEFDIKRPLPQEESQLVSGSVFQLSKLVEEMALRIENLPFLQKNIPFITYAKFKPISEAKGNSEATFDKELLCLTDLRQTRLREETFINVLFSLRKKSNNVFEEKHSSNEQATEIRLHGQSENLRKNFNDSTRGQSEIHFDHLVSASGKEEVSYIANELSQNKRIEDIANDLLLIYHKNSLQAENSNLKYNPLRHDFSFQCRQSQLYSETERGQTRRQSEIDFENLVSSSGKDKLSYIANELSQNERIEKIANDL